MALSSRTTLFLRYLHDHPAVRRALRASPGKALFYAGELKNTIGNSYYGFGYDAPVWRSLLALQKTEPQWADKEILPQVMERVPAPDTKFPSLRHYAESVEEELRRTLPRESPDMLIMWRALSGIYAANASGAVSFYLGAQAGAPQKVFAATEIWILLRNAQVDDTTRDYLAYLKRCLESGQADLNGTLLRA